MRAYAALANELPEAGYPATESNRITRQRDKALDWRQVIRLAAGENLDLKAYEADMRYLIDAYIEADHSRKISAFDDIGLLALIVKSGVAQAIAQQFGKGASNRKVVQETIENNTRRTIINERLNDPAFYDRMSQVLDEIIRFRKQNAEAYEEYLRRVADLARQLHQRSSDTTPSALDTPGKRALWSNLNGDLDLAIRSADELWLLEKGGAFHSGAPEDLVLNGAFAQAFRSEGIEFNPADGHFELHGDRHGEATVLGDGLPALWTRRALERIGIAVVPHAPYRITAAAERWSLQRPNGTSEPFPNLLALIESVRELRKESL
jgi:hypothetical protein